MRHSLIKSALFFITIITLQSTGVAFASPVRVDYSNIIAATTEDFEGYAYTDVGLSEPFQGFTASTTDYPLVIDAHSTICGTAGDTCLFSRTISSAVRTLSDFENGTLFVGFDLHKVSPTDLFSITVTGGSGSRTFISPLSGYIGFADNLGLFSIDVKNLGSGDYEGNYSFDDVITGISAVPLPPAMLLFAAALLGIGLISYRKIGWRHANH